MKAYKIEMIVCDSNRPERTLEDFKIDIDNSLDCIVHFIGETEKEIGEWSDEHPLNFIDIKKAKEYFEATNSL